MVDTIRCNMVAKFGRPTQCLAPGHKSVDKLFEKKTGFSFLREMGKTFNHFSVKRPENSERNR